MKRLGWTAFVAALTLVAIASAGAGYLYAWNQTANPPIPALAQDLPGADWSAKSAAFTARLRHMHAPGTSATALQDDLKSQGFRAGWIEKPGEEVAQFSWGAPVCNYFADVRWRADPDGRIIDVVGRVGEAGCL